MSVNDIVKVLLALLAALGGGGAIVIKLSEWIGKMWAENLLEKEKHRHAAELETIKLDLNQRLEEFKSELSIQSASLIGEDKALRDYRYEARKRLYEEIEPLLFQFAELAEEALHRVYSLARAARSGNLDLPDSWLRSEGYYMHSTMYKLIAPLAAIRLIQRRLTLVDLTVDPHIRAQYTLAKWLYRSFTDDFELARGEVQSTGDVSDGNHASIDQSATITYPQDYEPNAREWKEKRIQNEACYWRQGFPIGVLDKAADLLIVTDPGESMPRVMNFGAFEDAMLKGDTEIGRHFRIVIYDVLHTFHPSRRPILWRILITQSLLCLAIVRIRDAKIEGRADLQDFKALVELSSEEKNHLKWRVNDTNPEHDLEEALAIANSYLYRHVQPPFDRCLPPKSTPCPQVEAV